MTPLRGPRAAYPSPGDVAALELLVLLPGLLILALVIVMAIQSLRGQVTRRSNRLALLLVFATLALSSAAISAIVVHVHEQLTAAHPDE